MIVLEPEHQINEIRKACRLVAEYLEIVQGEIETREGVTTLELDKMATVFAKDNGAIPAFRGYRGFPYSICTSVNDEVVHGMPSDKPLQEGDILSVDYGILLNGYYGDSAITLGVGEISKSAEKLIETGRLCLLLGIQAFSKWSPSQSQTPHLNQISHTIQSRAESSGYSIVKEFTGHGIGKNLHEDPQVPNFTNKPDGGVALPPGTVLAIEPIVTEKSSELVMDKNKWTVRTKDGGLAVHWEHTAASTYKGLSILTFREHEQQCRIQKGELWKMKHYQMFRH